MFPSWCLLGIATLGVAIPVTQPNSPLDVGVLKQRRGLPVLGGSDSSSSTLGGLGGDSGDGSLTVLGNGGSDTLSGVLGENLDGLGGDSGDGSDTISIPHGGALQPADNVVIHGFSAGSKELQDLNAPDVLREGSTADQIEDKVTGDDSNTQQHVARNLIYGAQQLAEEFGEEVTSYARERTDTTAEEKRGLPIGSGGLGGGQAVLVILREIVSEATASMDGKVYMPQSMLTAATKVLGGLTGGGANGGKKGNGGGGGLGGIGGLGGFPSKKSDSDGQAEVESRDLPIVGGGGGSSSGSQFPGTDKATQLLSQIVRQATVSDVGGIQLTPRVLRTATLVLNQAGVGL